MARMLLILLCTSAKRSDLRITSLLTSKQSYSANENVLITATIENTGSAAISTIIDGQINDSSGNAVALITPVNPIMGNTPFWVMTIEPLSSVTVSITWNTGQYAPGDHQIDLRATAPSMHGSINIPGTILAQQGLSISIQPYVSIANSAVKCDPTFVYTGATSPLTVGLTLANQSNIPADLTIEYDIKSPSGAVLQSGAASAAITLDMITTTIPLTILNYTFVENGEYPIHAMVYSNGVKIGDIQDMFVVLSNIRIEPTRTVTPNIMLPNGPQKVTTTIQLSGKGQNPTSPHPAPSTINVPAGYKAELFASGLSSPVSIKANANDELYVVESAKDRIVKVSPTGSVSIFANSASGKPLDFVPGYPARMDLDNNGNLYVQCAGENFNNPYNPSGDMLDTIYKISPDGAVSILARQYFSPNYFYDIAGLTISPDGQLYLFIGDSWSPHDILKVNLVTKTSTRFASSVYSPVDLLFDKAGNLLVCMRGTSTEKIKILPLCAGWNTDGFQ